MTAGAALAMPSVEEAEQRFVDALDGARGNEWDACDTAAYLYELAATKRDKAKVVNRLAALGHCTSALVRIRIQLSQGFGTESRAPDVSQSLFRACLGAGRRLKLKPADVLEQALAKGLHAAEVRQLGQPGKRVRVLTAQCDGCGLKARLSVTDAETAPALVCPRCLAWAWADGRDGRDVERLGVLS